MKNIEKALLTLFEAAYDEIGEAIFDALMKNDKFALWVSTRSSSYVVHYHYNERCVHIAKPYLPNDYTYPDITVFSHTTIGAPKSTEF